MQHVSDQDLGTAAGFGIRLGKEQLSRNKSSSMQ
jgi:hypothetical protein